MLRYKYTCSVELSCRLDMTMSALEPDILNVVQETSDSVATTLYNSVIYKQRADRGRGRHVSSLA